MGAGDDDGPVRTESGAGGSGTSVKWPFLLSYPQDLCTPQAVTI